MRLLGRLTAAMGPPRAVREVVRGGRVLAAVARWGHRGIHADVGGGDDDAVHLIFNLTGGRMVDLRTADWSARGVAPPGSIGVTLPGRRATVRCAGPAETLQIVLAGDWVRLVTGRTTESVRPVFAAFPLGLQAVAAQAVWLLGRGRGDEAAAIEDLARRAADLLAGPAPVPRPAARGGLSPAARRRVHALLDARLAGDWFAPPAVGELAAVAGVSAGHFARAFRQSEGRSPYAAVNERRLGRAVSMLLRPAARVDDVAARLRFSSPAHFVDAFRRHVGVTPGAFRDAAVSPA